MIIAVDLGGTKTEIALFKKGKIIKKLKIKTMAKKGKAFVIKRLIKHIELISEGNKIKAIGVAIAGPTDSKKGIVYEAPNIPGFRNVKLKDILRKKFKVKVAISNDANLAALAESRIRKKDLVFLTLGTGVGSGVIINKEIYTGNAIASELGHMVIDFNGPKCTCGNNGCLEEYASGRALKRIAKKYNLNKNPKEIEKLARKGNKKAKKIYKEYGKNLGIGLANIANIFDPGLIILAGSLAKASSLFLNEAKKEMKRRAFKQATKNIKVEISRVKEPGILGAYYLLR